MYIEIDKILAKIGPDSKVLDLGGWDKVFPRANVVVDINPYETRRNNYSHLEEHFTKDSWIIDDFCSHSFWDKIPDKSFDFITIGHTLEDIRDPLYVCSQMIRCGKGGYIESPSRMRECSKESADAHFSGFAHHRWIMEPMSDLTGIVFKAKLAWAHRLDFLGDDKRYLLGDYFHHFDGYFWEQSFRYIEHFPKGMELEEAELIWFFDNVVGKNLPRNNVFDLVKGSKHSDDGKCLYVNEYTLPSERSLEIKYSLTE